MWFVAGKDCISGVGNPLPKIQYLRRPRRLVELQSGTGGHRREAFLCYNGLLEVGVYIFSESIILQSKNNHL